MCVIYERGDLTDLGRFYDGYQFYLHLASIRLILIVPLLRKFSRKIILYYKAKFASSKSGKSMPDKLTIYLKSNAVSNIPKIYKYGVLGTFLLDGTVS